MCLENGSKQGRGRFRHGSLPPVWLLHSHASPFLVSLLHSLFYVGATTSLLLSSSYLRKTSLGKAKHAQISWVYSLEVSWRSQSSCSWL